MCSYDASSSPQQAGCPLPPAWMAARPPPPTPRSDDPRYLKRIADPAPRQRRSVDAGGYTSDPSNWWYNLDSGRPNEVSAALQQYNPYAGAMQAQQQLMDQNSAPLSVTGGQAMLPYGGYPAYGYPPQLPYGYPAYGPPAWSYY